HWSRAEGNSRRTQPAGGGVAMGARVPILLGPIFTTIGSATMGNEPGRCTVGEYLAQRLEQAGVRHYFTVPGDFNLVLLDQLLKNPRLQLIGCCNELNAGYAAEGYARSNGIGALVVTYSVGGLSALNAVACAYAEDLPVVAISGGVNSNSEADG